jgi:hypothetical protein
MQVHALIGISNRRGGHTTFGMTGSWIRPNRRGQALAADMLWPGLDDLFRESRRYQYATESVAARRRASIV